MQKELVGLLFGLFQKFMEATGEFILEDTPKLKDTGKEQKPKHK
jgi:hypothetical protein